MAGFDLGNKVEKEEFSSHLMSLQQNEALGGKVVERVSTTLKEFIMEKQGDLSGMDPRDNASVREVASDCLMNLQKRERGADNQPIDGTRIITAATRGFYSESPLFGVIKKAAAAAIEASQYLAPRDSATVTDEQRDGFDAEDAALASKKGAVEAKRLSKVENELSRRRDSDLGKVINTLYKCDSGAMPSLSMSQSEEFNKYAQEIMKDARAKNDQISSDELIDHVIYRIERAGYLSDLDQGNSVPDDKKNHSNGLYFAIANAERSIQMELEAAEIKRQMSEELGVAAPVRKLSSASSLDGETNTDVAGVESPYDNVAGVLDREVILKNDPVPPASTHEQVKMGGGRVVLGDAGGLGGETDDLDAVSLSSGSGVSSRGDSPIEALSHSNQSSPPEPIQVEPPQLSARKSLAPSAANAASLGGASGTPNMDKLMTLLNKVVSGEIEDQKILEIFDVQYAGSRTVKDFTQGNAKRERVTLSVTLKGEEAPFMVSGYNDEKRYGFSLKGNKDKSKADFEQSAKEVLAEIKEKSTAPARRPSSEVHDPSADRVMGAKQAKKSQGSRGGSGA